MKPLNAATSRILDTLTAGLEEPWLPNAVSARTYDNGGGFMAAVVERIGPHRYSVAHYFEQNGDLVADPDLELVHYEGAWYASGITHAPPFGYTRALTCDDAGKPDRWYPRAYRELRSFATTLLRNVREQQGLKLLRAEAPR